MKKVLIPAILAVFALAYCGAGDSRRDATTVGSDGWVFEGWACAPDAAKALEGLSPAEYCQDDDNKDYLYLKFSARASQQAIQNGSIAMKQTTCRRAARDLVAGDGLSKIIGVSARPRWCNAAGDRLTAFSASPADSAFPIAASAAES